VLTHELGHNLGLGHSSSARCPSTQDMPTAGGVGCSTKEYDDPFDVMGNWGLGGRDGNLNAAHLDAMNLLPNAVHKIAPTPGVTTTRLTPLSGPLTTGTTDRALKMTDPNGNSYFVEYRTNSGRDALTGRRAITPTWGVRVLRDNPLFDDKGVRYPGSFVLDASPSTSTSDYNRVIPVGGVFTVISGVWPQGDLCGRCRRNRRGCSFARVRPARACPYRRGSSWAR